MLSPLTLMCVPALRAGASHQLALTRLETPRICKPCDTRIQQDLCAQVGVVDGEKTGKVDFEKFTKLIALQPRQPVAKADPSDPFAKLGLA